jgi:hypothetical protein
MKLLFYYPYYDEKIGKLMMRKRGSGFILVYVRNTAAYIRIVYIIIFL